VAEDRKVTVYLPTRNRAALVSEAIQSVLAQQYPQLELIVVDDGSTDETPSVVREWVDRDPRVIFVRNEVSRGAPSCRNIAINMATGRYCTGIDDDDLMLPDRLQSLVSRFDQRYAFICSSYWFEKSGRRRVIDGRDSIITLSDMLHANVASNQVLSLTARFREIGGFDEQMEGSQDYDLWTRLVERYGPAKRLAEPTYVMRHILGSGGITGSERARRGAQRYFSKHRHLMTSDHLKSQALTLAIVSRDFLSLWDFFRYFSVRRAERLLRYGVKQVLRLEGDRNVDYPVESPSKILVVGIVRDVGKFLESDVDRLREALTKIADLRWFLVESDSGDHTVEVLKKLASRVPHFSFVSLGSLQETYPDRTNRLAYCRNIYLERLEKAGQGWDPSYVVVADFDGVNDRIDSRGFQSCWREMSWDVMAANRAGPYYDIFALRARGWQEGDCFSEYVSDVKRGSLSGIAFFRHVVSKMKLLDRNSPLLPVESAFGGLAVYRREILRGARYSGVDSGGNARCEHVALHESIIAGGGRIFINPRLVAGGWSAHVIKAIIKLLVLFALGNTVFQKLSRVPR
jgi:glycosyltransferase involved in cell wall biosynthesis